MKVKSRMKKSSRVIVAALSLLAGSFSVAYAAEEYSFLIVRNMVSSTGEDQAWKSKDGAYAEVTVGSASSPSSYTTYAIYNYDDLISFNTELKNTSGNSGDILYQYGARNSGYFVNLRGHDGRGTAPNYSTVKGTWLPTK